jgi:hypothetical protein
LEDRLEIEKREDTTRDKGQFTIGGAQKSNSRLLQHLNTRISIGTEVRIENLPRIERFFMNIIFSIKKGWTICVCGLVTTKGS